MLFIGFLIHCSFSEFKLNAEELERWFTKIDHIFEHTRVPQIGEALTQFYKISIDKEQRHHLPIISHINYKYVSLKFKLLSYFKIPGIMHCKLEVCKSPSFSLLGFNVIADTVVFQFMPFKWAKKSLLHFSMPLMY